MAASEPQTRPSHVQPDPRGAFGGFIGPNNLRGLVGTTAPWLTDGTLPPDQVPEFPTGSDRSGSLFELAFHPHGWWRVLLSSDTLEAPETPSPSAWTDYFALCLSAHFATVMTYVPTDVDTKIRDRLWFIDGCDDERSRRIDLALALRDWDLRVACRRDVEVPGVGLISGHGGERLSVWAGGLLAATRAEDPRAAELEDAIHQELSREAEGFWALANEPGQEKNLLILAALLTHNAGDVDQGLSARKGKPVRAPFQERFGRLAHEGPERYGRAFSVAAKLYRELMASEGHRHYPLREVRCLRSHPDLLLPCGPFLDDWGARCAGWPAFELPQKAELVAALVNGIRKVPGQFGYHRALAGFDQGHARGLDDPSLSSHLPASVRKSLRDPDLRRNIAIRQVSFESGYRKRAREIIAAAG